MSKHMDDAFNISASRRAATRNSSIENKRLKRVKRNVLEWLERTEQTQQESIELLEEFHKEAAGTHNGMNTNMNNSRRRKKKERNVNQEENQDEVIEEKELDVTSVTVEKSTTPSLSHNTGSHGTPSPRREPNPTDGKRIHFVIAITGVIAGIAGAILMLHSIETPDQEKFKPLLIKIDDSSKEWLSYGCSASNVATTDKRGFRQCLDPGDKPNSDDKKHKLALLKELRKLPQVDARPNDFLGVSSYLTACEGGHCKKCTWQMRASGTDHDKCTFARYYFFMTNGKQIFTIPYKEKVDIKAISEMGKELDHVDEELMKEFYDLTKPWFDQFCPTQDGASASGKGNCASSPYFKRNRDTQRMERIRHINYLEWHSKKGYLLWSDSGKPSAINVAQMQMESKSVDKVLFKKAEPYFIFNNGEEPRGIATCQETLFYGAIYKPMTKQRFGKYWKGYIGAIDLAFSTQGNSKAASQKIYTHRKIIEPLDVAVDPYRWKENTTDDHRIIQVFATDRRHPHIIVIHFNIGKKKWLRDPLKFLLLRREDDLRSLKDAPVSANSFFNQPGIDKEDRTTCTAKPESCNYWKYLSMGVGDKCTNFVPYRLAIDLGDRRTPYSTKSAKDPELNDSSNEHHDSRRGPTIVYSELFDTRSVNEAREREDAVQRCSKGLFDFYDREELQGKAQNYKNGVCSHVNAIYQGRPRESDASHKVQLDSETKEDEITGCILRRKQDPSPGLRSHFFSSNKRDSELGLITSIVVKDGRVYFIDREWRLWTRPLHLPPSSSDQSLFREAQLILDPQKPECQVLVRSLKSGSNGGTNVIPVSFVLVDSISKLDTCKVWRTPIPVPVLC